MKTKQFYKRSILLLLVLAMMLPVIGCEKENGIALLSNHTLQTNTSFRISDAGIASVYVDYTGYRSAENVEITIEIKKRTAFVFWELVVSQTHTAEGEYFYHTYEYPMNEKGTYRCTVSYRVTGDGGKVDVITFEKTLSFNGAVGEATTSATQTTSPVGTTASVGTTTENTTYPPATVPSFSSSEAATVGTTETPTVTETTTVQTTTTQTTTAQTTTAWIPPQTTTTWLPMQTETTTAEVIIPPVLEHDIDFGGGTFTILCSIENNVRDTWEEIYAGDRTDEISLSLDRRLEEIETLYHCKIEVMVASDANAHVLADRIANRDRIDLFTGSTSLYTGMMKADAVYNLYAAGIDLNASYFNQNWVDAFTVRTEEKGNTLYSVLGAFSYGELLSANVMFYDKALFASEFPNTDLEALVISGDWTFDTLAAFAQSVAYDADGKGFDTWSNGDIYGLHYGDAYSFFYASGMSFVENRDGHMQLNTANLDGLTYVIDEVIRFLNIDGIRQYPLRAFEKDIKDDVQNYQMLFRSGTLEFADMYQLYEDFGVLPYPKVSESQSEYATSLMDVLLCTYSIPSTVSDIRAAAKFFELFAKHSEMTVKPVFYEVYGEKYGSAEMIALIEESIVFDPGYHYWKANIASSVLDKVNEDKNLVGAYFERATNRFDELYSSLLDAIKENKT